MTLRGRGQTRSTVSMRLPNFCYIGPSKAGSTWLHEVLIRHPQVFMTDAKDLYFFDRYFDRGTDWYAGHFRQAGEQHRVVGEVCQEYLSCPEAPDRMLDVLGSRTRVMVTVRDPVTRSYSAWLYMRKHGVFEGSFREALETRPLLKHSAYATLLQRYLSAFGREQVYCGVFDDLQRDAQAFVAGLLKWLDVEPLVLDDSLLQARLPASKARSPHLAKVAKRGANWARAHGSTALIGHVKRSPMLQKALYAPLQDKSGPSEADAAYVRQRLLPEIARFEDMVELDLRSRWGWER